MLPLERTIATFARGSLDKVAVHHISFSSRAASAVLGRETYVGGGVQQWREARSLWEGKEAHEKFIEKTRRDAIDLAKATEQDIIRYEYWRMETRPYKMIDVYTFMFGDPGGIWEIRRLDPETELFQIVGESAGKHETFEEIEEYVSGKEDSLRDYRPSAEYLEELEAIIQELGEEYAIRVNAGGIGIPTDSMTWLRAIVLKPDLVSRLFDVQAETAMRSMKPLREIGAKLIFGGGDLASNHGPFYSPDSFRELMLPRIKRVAEACHEHGMLYLFASDGNLWPIADDLFGESGVDGYYEIDRRAGMDLGMLRARFPELTLLGNISSHTLHEGSPKDVISETRSCIDEAKRNGGIVVGISNIIIPSTPIENLRAMLRTIMESRRM